MTFFNLSYVDHSKGQRMISGSRTNKGSIVKVVVFIELMMFSFFSDLFTKKDLLKIFTIFSISFSNEVNSLRSFEVTFSFELLHIEFLYLFHYLLN